ncbi:response regulator transcription factor [Gorillibacterium timonense]|uniref:response regulator transcription factor n=1 Tax=Gorillibacterium timonense TaxID=1689269 RepID=UPI00071C761B|nr:response regulator transcription factor [Gorillibacterium timonense]
MSGLSVLIVDDEWNMRNLLKIFLRKEGFTVYEAANGREALALIGKQSFAIVLLDVMLPDMDGWQVCRKIREENNVPLLMLTARTDTKDKVQGLRIGADDYVTKPFEPEELIARIHSLLRRTGVQRSQPANRVLHYSEMEIDPEGRRVMIAGKEADFTPKEFELFCLLGENPRRTFTREEIVERLWGLEFEGESRVVDTHVKNLREKAQRAGLSYQPIRTVWGVGYKFHADGAGE